MVAGRRHEVSGAEKKYSLALMAIAYSECHHFIL
jgi:hypothetical protein